MIKYINAYEELLTLIDIYKELYYSYEIAFYALGQQTCNASDLGSIDYSGMPHGKFANPPLQDIMQKMTVAAYNRDKAKETLEELEKNKEKIEVYIASLEGTKYKVAYLSVIRNKDIEFIAKSLGIKIGSVKNILTQIKSA